MKHDCLPPSPDRILHLDLDWRWHRPKHRDSYPKGEPRSEERPLRCQLEGHIISAPPHQLPFDDNCFDLIECGTVFAYVRNDEGLANELARITAPGGNIRLVVPADGLLAGLDAFNLHRYLVDITKRGLRPFETANIGWRRHYSESDLRKMFPSGDFTLVECRRFGIAASEVVRMSGFVLFRWWRASRNGYRTVSRIAQRLLSVEDKFNWSHGFWLELSLQKHESAARIEPRPR